MPAVSKPAKVLVTGSNGYIGLWVIHYLLQRVYAARAVVRSDHKGRVLIKLFEEEHPEGARNLDYVVVEDITAVR